jgi:transposase
MELLTMSTSEITRLAAMERLRTGGVTQAEVARQLGLSIRQIKRLWRRFSDHGPAGVVSRRRGRPSNRRLDPELVTRALALFRQHYADCGPTFAAEKLQERHDLRIDHETLRRALIASGHWKPRRQRRRSIHPPRERRPCFGELVQIDGSHHHWFEERGPFCTLYVAVDNATSALLALHFAAQETTEGYFALVRQLALAHGIPLAFYADRHSIFRITSDRRIAVEPTQFARAMHELHVELISAHTPQAKGRVERVNGTLQDRLVKELRYGNICDIDAANAFLPSFITAYNARFAKLPLADADAHRDCPNVDELDRILAVRHRRVISKNLTVHFENQVLQIAHPQAARRLRYADVQIFRDRHGGLIIECRGEALHYRRIAVQNVPPVLDAKALEHRPAYNPRTPNPKKAHTPPRTHPWKIYNRVGSVGGCL